MKILQMSGSASVLIVMMIMLRFISLKRLPKWVFPTMWGVVLIQLLFPFSIPVPVALKGFISDILGALTKDNGIQNKVENLAIDHNAKTTFNMPWSYISNTDHDTGIIIWIWIAGMVIALLTLIYIYRKNNRFFRQALPGTLSADMTQWLKDHGCYKNIPIKYMDQIKSPVTVGIFQSVVIIPPNMSRLGTSAAYAVAHEFAHVSRRDNFYKLLASIALCVHWFNPFVWLWYFFLQRDIEIACDEKVLLKVQQNDKSMYALTLIELSEKKTGYSIYYSGFGKSAIKERIVMIMKFKKASIASLFAAGILLGSSVAVFAFQNAGIAYGENVRISPYQSEMPMSENDTKGGGPVIEFSDSSIYESSQVSASEDAGANNIEMGDGVDQMRMEFSSEIAEELSEFGLSYNKEKDQLYFNGTPIFFIADNEKSDGNFKGRVISNRDGHGTTGVVTVRENGKIIGLKQLSEKESKKYSNKYW